MSTDVSEPKHGVMEVVSIAKPQHVTASNIVKAIIRHTSSSYIDVWMCR